METLLVSLICSQQFVVALNMATSHYKHTSLVCSCTNRGTGGVPPSTEKAAPRGQAQPRNFLANFMNFKPHKKLNFLPRQHVTLPALLSFEHCCIKTGSHNIKVCTPYRVSQCQLSILGAHCGLEATTAVPLANFTPRKLLSAMTMYIR